MHSTNAHAAEHEGLSVTATEHQPSRREAPQHCAVYAVYKMCDRWLAATSEFLTIPESGLGDPALLACRFVPWRVAPGLME